MALRTRTEARHGGVAWPVAWRGEAWRGVACPRPCGLLVPRFPSMALLTYLLWLCLLWHALPEVSS